MEDANRPAKNPVKNIFNTLEGLVLIVGVLTMTWLETQKMQRKKKQQQAQETQQSATLARQAQTGHETRDASACGIVLAAVVLVVVVAGSVGGLWFLYGFYTAREVRADPLPPPVAQPGQLPPEPRLQVNPALEWQELRAAQEALLRGYGWIDREAGVVRIPIEQAIDLVATEGLPARDDGTYEYAFPDAPDLDSSGGQNWTVDRGR